MKSLEHLEYMGEASEFLKRDKAVSRGTQIDGLEMSEKLSF